jgi:hypothetical protein
MPLQTLSTPDPDGLEEEKTERNGTEDTRDLKPQPRLGSSVGIFPCEEQIKFARSPQTMQSKKLPLQEKIVRLAHPLRSTPLAGTRRSHSPG